MKRSADDALSTAVDSGDAAQSTTAGGLMSASTHMPLKRYFRTRAHCNPLSHNDGFNYPISPQEAKWELHYPDVPAADRVVTIVDVGMGFGGLTVALAALFPDKLVLGMEIRAKVCEYVRLKILALRAEALTAEAAAAAAGGHHYRNAACLRTNCMRYLPNFFVKGQLEKIFFCFPDPHFKAKNHRRRIVRFGRRSLLPGRFHHTPHSATPPAPPCFSSLVSDILLSEYAYVLAPGGRLYTVTDVEELHQWHVAKVRVTP
jgi:tRNA (guanine-N7-)-methyltransferase